MSFARYDSRFLTKKQVKPDTKSGAPDINKAIKIKISMVGPETVGFGTVRYGLVRFGTVRSG